MSSSLKLPMTYDVTCGHCHGRLRVESTMESVACPHCGDALAVPEDAAALEGNPTLSPLPGHAAATEPSPPHTTAVGAPTVFDSSVIRAADAVGGSSPDFSQWGAGSSTTTAPADFTPAAFPPPEPAEAASPTFDAAPPPAAAPAAKDAVAPPPAAVPVAASATSKSLSPAPRAAASSETVPRKTFLALMVYASIVTALCLGLLFLQLSRRSHQLESLPDVVPPRDEDGQISHILAPADAALPPGHVLALGESRRFGDLKVTAVKVTREPLGFTHYRDQTSREPAGEVLKLWLEFENVSDDGKNFAPLDGELLFYRGPSAGGAYALRANNFLAPADDRSPDSLIGVYDHPPESDWNLAGQNLDTVLAPGDSVVMYVPTETGVAAPDGPLAWRVHLRKGLADNGWGVTTLVEVAFDANDVQGS